MKEFTIEEIIDYADKLLIGLSKEEASSIKEEFSCIDKNIDKINNIPNLQSVTPSAFPFNLYTASLREDVAEPSVPIELLLANDKAVEGREVKVPKVVRCALSGFRFRKRGLCQTFCVQYLRMRVRITYFSCGLR